MTASGYAACPPDSRRRPAWPVQSWCNKRNLPFALQKASAHRAPPQKCGIALIVPQEGRGGKGGQGRGAPCAPLQKASPFQGEGPVGASRRPHKNLPPCGAGGTAAGGDGGGRAVWGGWHKPPSVSPYGSTAPPQGGSQEAGAPCAPLHGGGRSPPHPALRATFPPGGRLRAAPTWATDAAGNLEHLIRHGLRPCHLPLKGKAGAAGTPKNNS